MDNTYIIWSSFFVILLVMYWTYDHYSILVRMHLIRKRRKGGQTIMNEALQAFIGKECTIVTAAVSGSVIRGVVKSVEGSWLTVMSGRPGAEKNQHLQHGFHFAHRGAQTLTET